MGQTQACSCLRTVPSSHLLLKLFNMPMPLAPHGLQLAGALQWEGAPLQSGKPNPLKSLFSGQVFNTVVKTLLRKSLSCIRAPGFEV